MAETSLFDAVATELERATALGRLEARGTLRLALRTAGLEGGQVSRNQMAVVLEKVLPAELEVRGVTDVADVGRTLLAALARLDESADAARPSPADLFRRVSGA